MSLPSTPLAEIKDFRVTIDKIKITSENFFYMRRFSFFDPKYKGSLSNITAFLFELFTTFYEIQFSEEELKSVFSDIYKIFDFTKIYTIFKSQHCIYIKDKFLNITNILNSVKVIIEEGNGIENTWNNLIKKLYSIDRRNSTFIKNIIKLVFIIYYPHLVRKSENGLDNIGYFGTLDFLKKIRYNNKKDFTVMIIIIYFYNLINSTSRFSEHLLHKSIKIPKQKSLFIDVNDLDSPNEKLLENQFSSTSSNQFILEDESGKKRSFDSLDKSVNNSIKINSLIDTQKYMYDIESLIKKHRSLTSNIQSLLKLEEETLNEIEEKWSLFRDLMNN
jgi:hypothetical protein